MSILINPNIIFSGAGLFQSDSDWIHPKRNECTHEIIYVNEGQVYMREGENEIAAKKGDLFLLSPNVWHCGTKVTKNVSFYWVHFSANGELPFEKRFFTEFQNSYLFKELLHCNNLPTVPEGLVNAVLLHILSELSALASEDTLSYNGQAEKVYEWIRINAYAGLTVRNVAEHFGYSADHVSRICKKHFAVNAKALINRFLLAKAKSLLSNTSKYVKEISGELGFTSDKAFIAYFKYHEGCFPSDYRNRYGKLHMNSK